jgi:hypothetical protein
VKGGRGTLLLLVLFGAVVVRAGTVLGLDSDYVLHRAYGRAILAAHGPWLAEDPTIYTAPGVPPVLHEWGAEALFAALDAAFGSWGPVRLAAVIGALVPWLLFRRALRATGSFWPAMTAWVVSGAGIATGLLVRPHLFSVAGFYVCCRLLERWRLTGDHRRLFPALAAVIVLWTNLHGGGALVWLAVLLGLYAASNRRVAGAAALPFLYALTLLNPWGLHLHRHVLRFLTSAGPRAAADMGPPDLRTGTLFVLLAMAAALGLAARRRFRPAGRTPASLASVAFIASVLSMRNLPLLGVALGQLLPEVLDGWLAERPALAEGSRQLAAGEPARSVAGWVLAAFVLLPVGALPQPRPTGPQVPAAAIAWLAAHPELGRRHGYADYDDAGFLLDAGVVERVYLHSLNANTPVALEEDRALLDGGTADWARFFDPHQVVWALVRPSEPLAARLMDSGWIRRWGSGDRVLLARP